MTQVWMYWELIWKQGSLKTHCYYLAIQVVKTDDGKYGTFLSTVPSWRNSRHTGLLRGLITSSSASSPSKQLNIFVITLRKNWSVINYKATQLSIFIAREKMETQTYRAWQMKVCALVAQSCPTLCDPTDCGPPGCSVRWILQARILEWVAIPFSRGSFRPRDRTEVSRTAGRLFTFWASREADRFTTTLP